MTTRLKVAVREMAEHTLISVEGDVYYDTIDPLRDVLVDLAASGQLYLVLDLSGVATCDSSGLNLMVQAQRLATRRGGWLRLLNPQPGVRRVLELTNLTRLLTVQPSAETGGE
jgi:anti-anti-sigma factor